MPEVALPAGRYLSIAFRVSLDAGGQTRALLLRNRMLARAGVRPDIVVLGAAPDFDRRRQQLLERGLLTEEIGMLNIYEHYRHNGWGRRKKPIGKELADIAAHTVSEESDEHGAPWRITYRVPGDRYATYDYLRTDGSPYLRIPAFGLAGGSRGRGRIQLVGADRQIVGELRTAGQWFRRWVRRLAARNVRTFVFIDSRHVVPHLVPLMRVPRVHMVYVMHNLHVGKPYRWDSEISLPYRRVLARIDEMDAFVTLTERQRDDIAERHGRTRNMFVVPNPVDLPPPPAEPPARDPQRAIVTARLEPQKRLQDAIAAFERVVRELPHARLDIYGDGSRRDELQQEIDRRGIGSNVVLHGFDPDAREELWRSSAFVLSSSFEGYPLSTLESMSRGCPVVAYDCKYGPREQISDGVDGFLVPRGDVDALAGRLIELLRSPALVARMSTAAREAARGMGPDRFLADWAHVLQRVVELRLARTRIDEIALATEKLRTVRGGRIQFAGALRVKAKTRKGRLEDAQVGLAAIEDGTVIELPLKVEQEEGALLLRAPTGPLRRGPAVPEGARLRLRFTWENSAWETELAPGTASARRANARARLSPERTPRRGAATRRGTA